MLMFVAMIQCVAYTCTLIHTWAGSLTSLDMYCYMSIPLPYNRFLPFFHLYLPLLFFHAGYRYGKSLIPVSSTDEAAMKMDADRCLALLGFTKMANVRT